MLERLMATGSLVETRGRKMSGVAWLMVASAVVGYLFGVLFSV